MAFVEGGNDGTLNGTTPVTVVAAPAASTRRIVKTITVYNADTLPVTIRLRLVSAGGTRVFYGATLNAAESFAWDVPIVLDATTKSITAVMSGAPATTQPDYTSSWGDAT